MAETKYDDEENIITVHESPISQMGLFHSESDDEIIREMMEKEKQHLPRDDYIKRLKSGDSDLNTKRSEALKWIWKACEEHQFGPLCICLSVNYLDRFLSVYDLPSGKAWILQLLAMACLSLAAKIEDLEVGDFTFVFEAKSVQRMEILVLKKLKWRLRAITPCSFVRYFLRKMIKCGDQESLVLRSLQVIANTTKGIDFLEYRPCEVAAAVALSVSRSLHSVHFDNTSFSPPFSLVQKERVNKIVEMIEIDGSLGLWSQTPNGVLEVSASCFSFKTFSPHTNIS